MKTALNLILIISLFWCKPAFAYTEISAYLCEIGLDYYNKGMYDAALHEFKKALLSEPDYRPALEYTEMVLRQISRNQAQGIPSTPAKVISSPRQQVLTPLSARIIPPKEPVVRKEEASEEFAAEETQRPVFVREPESLVSPEVQKSEDKEVARETVSGKAYFSDDYKPQPKVSPPVLSPPAEERSLKPYPFAEIVLDDSLQDIIQPIQISQGRSISVLGRNIYRFLSTQPDIVEFQKLSNDEVLVVAKNIGSTYAHFWDDSGRWTIDFLGVFPEPEGPTMSEILEQNEETARHFKLGYSLDWGMSQAARKISDLRRSSYWWTHGLRLNGPSPYGDIDSALSVQRLRTSTDLTYFTLGLTGGRLWDFKDFSLRGFDFSAPFSNLVFPGASLRGVVLTSPAFNNKIHYSGFWGREGGGRYGRLSPGLGKIKNSFLDGINVDYAPDNVQHYNFSLLSGSGRDRESYLNTYGYDFTSNWNLGDTSVGYEIAHDSENSAQLLTARYIRPFISLASEFRNISKKFMTMTGSGWRQGELGAVFNVGAKPLENLQMSAKLDIYQNRLYPALDNDNRLNELLDLGVDYQLDPGTVLNAGYSLQNNLGAISQSRYQTANSGISRRIKFIKDIYTYLRYTRQESKSYSAPSADYINDKIYSGLRFNLIGDLYYYLNKEINWLEARYYADHYVPHAWESGLDWSSQLWDTPFYGNMRFTYRDEQNTESTSLSLLSGEDYIEGYSQLSYRPGNDSEIFGSFRLRNVWAENPSLDKKVDVFFNAGLRYLWDSGFSWETTGNIEGYVFQDWNSDGLRQRDEPPVKEVRVLIGKDKSEVTDIFGYYCTKGVKARKVNVRLDTDTLPDGFILTGPQSQEVQILQNKFVKADFGIISRSEINGFIFEDIDADGLYTSVDKGVRGVMVKLDTGQKVISDDMGRYSFPTVTTGIHTVTVDLNSLPIYYLPKLAITKKIIVEEGTTHTYLVPLKKIQE